MLARSVPDAIVRTPANGLRARRARRPASSCACSAAPRAALTFPPLTGRVVDDAAVLDPATRALTEKLAALEAKTTDQLVVATVRIAAGHLDRGLRQPAVPPLAARTEGQEQRRAADVAPNERKVRIEVGYGLEGHAAPTRSRG